MKPLLIGQYRNDYIETMVVVTDSEIVLNNWNRGNAGSWVDRLNRQDASLPQYQGEKWLKIYNKYLKTISN